MKFVFKFNFCTHEIYWNLLAFRIETLRSEFNIYVIKENYLH